MVKDRWTNSNNIKSWHSSKKSYVINLIWLQGNCLLWTLTTQPNDQFWCIHWTIKEIKQCSWRKTARIGKSKRYCILSWQMTNYWSFVGIFCHMHHTVLALHHLITFCFDLYKTPWMEKNVNNNDVKSCLIQFFANKNQKFYERGIMMPPERWQQVINQSV